MDSLLTFVAFSAMDARSVFIKIDRSTQKLTAGRSKKGLTRARIHYFDIRHSLFQSFFLDLTGRYSGQWRRLYIDSLGEPLPGKSKIISSEHHPIPAFYRSKNKYRVLGAIFVLTPRRNAA